MEVRVADGMPGPEFDCALNSCEACRKSHGGKCERQEDDKAWALEALREAEDDRANGRMVGYIW